MGGGNVKEGKIGVEGRREMDMKMIKGGDTMEKIRKRQRMDEKNEKWSKILRQ